MSELLLHGLYKQEILELQTKLEEIEEKKISIRAQNITGMGGRGPGRFEEQVFRYEKVHLELVQATERYIEAKSCLLRKIERLEEERYKEILFYRYVCGYSMKALKDAFGCNERWIYRMLKQAKQEYERMVKNVSRV